jgi:crossover junction endodeoxyribonuclease RuvC
MPKTKTRVLAIDPGTREMGVALMEEGKIIYHGVKCIKRKSPQDTLREGRRVVLRIIRDFGPDVLVIEKTFFANNRNASILNVFADDIKAVAKRKGLEVISYAPSTVKKYIAGNGRASKEEVAKVIIARYPELKVYLHHDRKWKQKYHLNMFDAVALGMMASGLK